MKTLPYPKDSEDLKRLGNSFSESMRIWKQHNKDMELDGFQTQYVYMKRREWRKLPVKDESWNGDHEVRNIDESDPRTYKIMILKKQRIMSVQTVTFTPEKSDEKLRRPLL